MTLIELSDQDAQLFVLFQRNYQKFALLVEHQVFDVKNGSAELHFDRKGDIASIDLHAKVYRRGSVLIEPIAIVKQVL